MSFNEEWSALRATHTHDRPSHMQLAQAPAEGGGGGGADLTVKQDDLGAVGHDAYVLHQQLKKAGDIAGASAKGNDGASLRAASQLSRHSFSLGHALSTTVSVWSTQLDTVVQGCAHISNHLDYTNKSHSEEDAKIAATMRHRDGSAMTASEIYKFIK